jgi:APA family basic amino acid/polyamine antiporter
MSNKIGFWPVFALVTGSQIGSGIFMLPASLAPYGQFSFAGWIISSFGAIALSLVFASLCSKLPQTGGPHVYINKAFGPTFAFFTGWTYWVISWVSTTAVIITSISYLSPFIGNQSPIVYLTLEIFLLVIITFLNLKGLKAAGATEVFLTFLKFIPLLIMPLAAICFFDKGNLSVSNKVASLSISQILGQVTLITLWGFIGLESATTPAGSVKNPSKTIPRAIVSGTLCVALLYFVNSIGIIGLIKGSDLASSKAPYVDAAQMIFGGNWHLLISAIASIVCIGTLNAWILTSGQIALGLSSDGLMPNFFAKKNSNEAPIWGIIISCLGIVPLLILTANESISTQITTIIDFSVTAFLFVYLICSIALLKLLMTQEKTHYLQCVLASIAIIFCGWVIYETPLKTLIVASLFTLSGIPIYLFWYCYNKKNKNILESCAM